MMMWVVAFGCSRVGAVGVEFSSELRCGDKGHLLPLNQNDEVMYRPSTWYLVVRRKSCSVQGVDRKADLVE